MFIDEFNPKAVNQFKAKDWVFVKADKASDEIIYNYIVGDTESCLTITILPSTNDTYYHVKTFQEIWFYEDDTRDELEDYQEKEKTHSFMKTAKKGFDGPYTTTTIEDIVGSCLSKARSILVSPLDAVTYALKNYNTFRESANISSESKKQTGKSCALVEEFKLYETMWDELTEDSATEDSSTKANKTILAEIERALKYSVANGENISIIAPYAVRALDFCGQWLKNNGYKYYLFSARTPIAELKAYVQKNSFTDTVICISDAARLQQTTVEELFSIVKGLGAKSIIFNNDIKPTPENDIMQKLENCNIKRTINGYALTPYNISESKKTGWKALRPSRRI